MGKSKQSQRTKNNVKPSSSGRSAELLNSGKVDTGVISLAGGKIFPTLVSTTADNDINPEFQMCLKKLNKKDPVTKTKGLQELTDLVNSSKVDDVVAILSSWAHSYKTLSIDVDRKVREHTQTCHGAVVRACGRRAAPALRQLVPAWLRAGHDAHAPAAARARHSLASTFPDSKLPDVISFCKTEIFSYIVENLTSSPDAILTKKIESEDDRELQYNDVVSSSLQTLAYLTQQLAREHDDWLWDALANRLLQHSAFWKYSTHTCNQIRAAWYDAIGRIIERFGSLFGEKYGLKTMRILMGVSKEQNGLVAASLWSCLVMIMHNIEAWHTYLDKKELIVKRILDVLTNGGWGDARQLSGVLLPLLASLPHGLLTKHFYQQFFQAMFTGLTQKSILSSKSERQLWITNVAECLRYLSVQNDEFVVEVTTSVHRTWLENILSNELCGQLSTNLIKHSATNMVSLVKYWLKQSKEPNGGKFNKLIRNFWQNIGSTLLSQIDKLSTDENDIVSLIDRHVLLLQTLKTSFMQETRNQQVNKKIKFDTDSEVDVEQNSPTPEKCDPILAERYKHNLEDVVNNVCAYYFNFAHEMKAANAVIPPLLTLLIEFDGEELFSAVARQFGAKTLVKFHETVLSSWLRDAAMSCEALVHVVFLLLRHLPACDQRVVMDSFDKLGARAAEWGLQVALAHPHRSRLAVRCWLHGPAADAALHALCTSLAAAPGHALRNLLLMCFSQHDQEELLISDRAVCGVVDAVSAALCAGVEAGEGEAEGELEERCRAGAQLSAALLGRAHAPASRLLLALARVILRVPRGSGRLSAGTWCEVRGAVQDGAGALPGPARAHLLHQLACLMREPYCQHKQGAELELSRVEAACTLCPYLVSATSQPPADLGELVTFTEDLFEADYSYCHAEHFALRHDCVHSNLNCPFEGDNPHLQRIAQESSTDADSELTKDQLVWFLGRLVLRTFYLRTLFLHKPEEEDDESIPSWCNKLLSHKYFLMEYAKVLYDYMIICTLHEGYGFWPHHCIIREGKAKLDLLLGDIVRETPPDLRKKVLSKLCDLASSDGLYWAYAREHYSDAIHSPANQHRAAEPLAQQEHLGARLAELEASVSGNGFFHSLQANTQSSESVVDVTRSKFLVMARCVLGSSAAPAELRPHAEACSLDLVIRAYYPHNRIMIFDTDITPEPWSKVVTNVAVLEYLIEIVNNEGWTLPTHHWDFINIACCSVITSVEKSKHAWGTAKVAMVSRAALRLFAAVQRFVRALAAEGARRPPAHVARLPHEWQHIFAPAAHDHLFRTIVHVLDAAGAEAAGVSSCRAAALSALCDATRHLDWSSLSKELQLDTFALSRVCAAAARCLARPLHVAYKFLAHDLLAMLVDPLILEDMAKLSMWSDQTASDGREEYDRPKLALEYFDEQIDYLQDIVNAVVAHVELGGGVCEVREFSDSHSQCVGWLLLLRVSHKLFARARSTVALHYLEIYRDNNFAEPVLNAALRLLPEQLFAFAEDNTGSAQLPPHCADMFFHRTPLHVHEPVRAALVGALACGALCAGVVCAAAGARAWASAAPAPRARALRRLVRACITPTLVKEHFTAVMRAAPDFANAAVTIYWSTYEVMCVYTVDERPMELHITLAKDYPVGVATVHAPSVLTPCADTNWVALYLAHQNGSVVEAVRMWMQGVEARVENSPVCYICYSRLQPASGRLPRVTCHQCRNKFHVTCLNKWFHTSVKSSCPLCRAIF